jgi:opacity protein-like surface antigen
MMLSAAGVAALTCAAASAQTTISASAFGAFNGSTSTSTNSTAQSPSNQAGGMLQLRHIVNPLVGFEATYSFNRANQAYSDNILNPALDACPAGLPDCGSETQTAAIQNNAHEIAGDWIVSFKVGKLRPFALAGAGVLVNAPSGGTVTTAFCGAFSNLCSASTTNAATTTSATGVYVYGAGVDWTLVPHIGLRLQYRGNVYKAPSLVSAFTSTNAFTQSAEPMIGVVFKL